MKLLIQHFPSILIIQLKRFKNNIKKVTDMIIFPFELYIETSNSDVSYDLYGIINHSGSIQGGHYFAYIKCKNDIWYNFNDSSVTEIDTDKVVTSDAYILLYRKMSH
jgi:ubiquitin C-terminal hydrolase